MKTLIQQLAQYKFKAKTLQKEEYKELQNLLTQIEEQWIEQESKFQILQEKYLDLKVSYKKLEKELEEVYII